jgi:hypothetical protein
MEKYDGFLKVEKTRILPLRWIGNACGSIGVRSLLRAFALEDQGNFGYRFTFHCKVWKYLYKPQTWWGTYYQRDIDLLTDSESQDS